MEPIPYAGRHCSYASALNKFYAVPSEQVGWFMLPFARGNLLFSASAAASSAYLTVGEAFPLEVRAVAISVFYALGTALGGIAGPAVFGHLLRTGSRDKVLIGYLIGSGLVVGAAVVEAVLGVDVERRSLEEVAPALSSL